MRRIKRLVSTFACTLALLMWICAPVQAEYMGELRRDLAWTLNVDNSAAAGGTAISVAYLISRRNETEITREEIEIRLVPGEARLQLFFPKPGRNVRRIVIEVDAPRNATIIVDLTQASTFPSQIHGRGTLVFDVVDAP